ncbi:MAG: ExbD/TolR family protein [Bdellovibrionales bacterium]
MAQIDGPSEGRQTNVEPNLVPFIDLMSVCIIFLLVTAVWTQVSMIELGSSIYGKNTGNDSQNIKKVEDIFLQIRLTNTGYIVKLQNSSFQIPKLEGNFNKMELYNQLVQIKQRFPENSSATISLQDNLEYNDMIEGMDAILNAGFPEVAVATQ